MVITKREKKKLKTELVPKDLQTGNGEVGVDETEGDFDFSASDEAATEVSKLSTRNICDFEIVFDVSFLFFTSGITSSTFSEFFKADVEAIGSNALLTKFLN